jgi:hypothetical protein
MQMGKSQSLNLQPKSDSSGLEPELDASILKSIKYCIQNCRYTLQSTLPAQVLIDNVYHI